MNVHTQCFCMAVVFNFHSSIQIQVIQFKPVSLPLSLFFLFQPCTVSMCPLLRISKKCTIASGLPALVYLRLLCSECSFSGLCSFCLVFTVNHFCEISGSESLMGHICGTLPFQWKTGERLRQGCVHLLFILVNTEMLLCFGAFNIKGFGQK